MQKEKMMAKLSKGEQFIYDWQYKRHGSFNEALAMAFSKADSGNFAALSKGFPEIGEAFTNFYTKEGWWESVQRQAND